MLNLDQAVKAVATAASWPEPAADAQGVYRIRLEGDLSLEVSTPDGRHCVLSTELGDLPSDARDDYWVRLGKLACGSLRRRPSTLALDGNRLELFRFLDLSEINTEDLAAQVQGFLNDQAWWRSELSGGSAGASPSSSPFAFGPNWAAGDWKL